MVKDILTELRRQMNGAVSQSMRELGQSDSLNFGVSLPTIKSIALKYSPNQELACKLNARKSREAHIAALYVADATLTTEQMMQQWSENWQTQEIARLSAMLLFHKCPSALSIAAMWINSTALRQVAALYIIGKNAATVPQEIIQQVLKLTSTDAATTFCLREIYYARAEFRTVIHTLATQNDELAWQIDLCI